MFGLRRDAFETMSDTDLLERVRNQSAEAFEELYRRHAGAVVAIARQFTADRQVADEATQSAFLQLWQYARDLDAKSRLRAWLATVVRHKVFDQQRRKRFDVVPIEEEHDRQSNAPTPEEHAITRERSSNIENALRALPEEQRAVIELAYFGGLSQTEISNVTGISLGTVKSRTRLAMQRLRTMITDQGVFQ
jgi:RNA polymerase sigma-70 factor, ECF subfamily